MSLHAKNCYFVKLGPTECSNFQPGLLNDPLGARCYAHPVRESVMSFRLKSFLVVLQLSLVIWSAIIYAGYMVATATYVEVDKVHTASVR